MSDILDKALATIARLDERDERDAAMRHDGDVGDHRAARSALSPSLDANGVPTAACRICESRDWWRLSEFPDRAEPGPWQCARCSMPPPDAHIDSCAIPSADPLQPEPNAPDSIDIDIAHVKRALSEPLPAIADAKGWRERLTAHCDRRRAIGGQNGENIEHLAIGALVCEMHTALTAVAPLDRNRCAGCGARLTGDEMELGDGAVVHADPDWKCLRAYGAEWRKHAAEQLDMVGISVPADLVSLN